MPDSRISDLEEREMVGRWEQHVRHLRRHASFRYETVLSAVGADDLSVMLSCRALDSGSSPRLLVLLRDLSEVRDMERNLRAPVAAGFCKAGGSSWTMCCIVCSRVRCGFSGRRAISYT